MTVNGSLSTGHRAHGSCILLFCLRQQPQVPVWLSYLRVSRNPSSENRTVLALHPVLYSSLKPRPYFYNHTGKFFLCSRHNSLGSRDSSSCNETQPSTFLHVTCDRASSTIAPSLSLPRLEAGTQDPSHHCSHCCLLKPHRGVLATCLAPLSSPYTKQTLKPSVLSAHFCHPWACFFWALALLLFLLSTHTPLSTSEK